MSFFFLEREGSGITTPLIRTGEGRKGTFLSMHKL